jgi:hypothetical protein
LQRSGRQRFSDANVVPRAGPDGIVGHKLPRNLYGEFVIETAQDINATQFGIYGDMGIDAVPGTIFRVAVRYLSCRARRVPDRRGSDRIA